MPTQALTPLGLAILLAALAGSGCVIPLGPDWEGPEANYAPYVVTSTPTVGEIFTPGSATSDREITVTLSDQNLNDNLSIRFLIDYPNTDTSTAQLFFLATLPPTGVAERGPVRVRPNCA